MSNGFPTLKQMSVGLNPYSLESVGLSIRTLGSGSSPASTVYPVANKAIYVPFVARSQITFTSLFTGNGATATGNIDIGVYASDGTRIISTGSTAMAGTSARQIVTVAATTIGPGVYYLAMTASSTSATFAATTAPVIGLQCMGVYQQTTALPLPATATFATASSTYLPIFGITTIKV